MVFSPIQFLIEVDEKCGSWKSCSLTTKIYGSLQIIAQILGQIGKRVGRQLDQIQINDRQIVTYKMKIDKHEKHLQMFSRQFLDNTHQAIQITENNLLQNNNKSELNNEHMIVSNLINVAYEETLPKQNIDYIKYTYQQQEPIQNKLVRRKFKLSLQHYLFQVFAAYALTIGLMYLNKVVYFPFFQAIIVVMISVSSTPIDITNGFIMLGIPISIANYNLGVWILTYPLIIICYFSRFLFTNRVIKSLLWIVSSVIQFIFGFVVIPSIGNSLAKESKFVLYYLYPWLLVIVKAIVGLINEVIVDTNILLLQVSLFLQGLSYGMLLTLQYSNIQYWYLLVILTLQIINSRYQFLLTIVKNVLKIKTNSIIEAHTSGYLALNQIHIIIFIYAVCLLGLSTHNFQYKLQSYVDNLLVPFVAWAFFLAYQTISIIRLTNSQQYVILGYSSHTYLSVFVRALALSLGLWFFFLGLGIPSVIFSS